jgi:hypothetical protein
VCEFGVLKHRPAEASMPALTHRDEQGDRTLGQVEQIECSYGRRNRQAIAAREARVASRLRAVEHAYRMADDRDAVSSPPDAPRAFRSPEHALDREIELE